MYVANQGESSVSIIDARTNVVARRVDFKGLGFSETAKPHHIAVEEDGSHWYVSLIGENRVVKLDRQNRVVGKAETEVPGLLVLDERNDRLYVGRSMSAVNAPSSVAVIGLSTGEVDEFDVFFPRPHALAVAPSGDFVYSASLAENTIAAVNTETVQVELIRLGGNPEVLVQFAVSPDSLVMIAGGQLSGDVHFFDISNPPWLTRTGWTTVGLGAWHPVFSNDGLHAYVPNKMVNTVTVLDMSTRDVSSVVSGAGLAEPHGAALSPDGRYLYVSNNNLKGTYTPRHDLGYNSNAGTVVVIDTGTNEIVKVLEVGSNATGIGSRRGS
ncbi:MAG: YncE family protein [Rhodothermia bacterium]|nr:YncE family protein [Rhodothermia bacterium]